jgi:hypothetical protein
MPRRERSLGFEASIAAALPGLRGSSVPFDPLRTNLVLRFTPNVLGRLRTLRDLMHALRTIERLGILIASSKAPKN